MDSYTDLWVKNWLNGWAQRKQPQVAPGKIRLDIRKNFLGERMVKRWNRLSGKVRNFPPPEVLKRCVDVASMNMG